MPLSRTRAKKSEFLRIIDDPALFAKVLLRHNLWSKQEEILRSVVKHPRTAVKACHASSKTFTAADAVLWWITHQQEAIALTTAPTWVQVEKQLWPHIHRAVGSSTIDYL